MPSKGAYILAPSHRSILDVPFAAYVTSRTVRFLAKDDLFKSSFGRKLFDALGAVEVERGTADQRCHACARSAYSNAWSRPGRHLPRGHPPLWPEITELFAGAAYLSVKFGVPIVPVGIGGSEHILPKGKLLPRIHRVAVSVGEPLDPPVLEGRGRRGSAAKHHHRAVADVAAVACFDDADARQLLLAAPRTSTARRRAGRRSRTRSRGHVSAAATPRQRGRGERRRRFHQLAQLARRREVLVLFGDVHRHDVTSDVGAMLGAAITCLARDPRVRSRPR